ncbi:hypothetical protein MLD38_025604 [Melastoma candidum]|uniref:Uncharacterized protein n=1 Tax=Melastoma candidum TaxID=119954 RepID=A0ACB9NWU3_9MYRT|nr:hypothetical protein MLD38_025604 [Melastoma candidum]
MAIDLLMQQSHLVRLQLRRMLLQLHPCNLWLCLLLIMEAKQLGKKLCAVAATDEEIRGCRNHPWWNPYHELYTSRDSDNSWCCQDDKDALQSIYSLLVWL